MNYVMGVFRKEVGKNYIVPQLYVLKDQQLFGHKEFQGFPKFYLQEMVDTPFEVLTPEDQAEMITAYCEQSDGLFVFFAPHSKDVPIALEKLREKYIEACNQVAS